MSVAFNTARYDALVISLESARAGLPALSEACRDAADLANAERTEALRLSPLVGMRNVDMPDLVQGLVEEHGRLLADPQHRPDHEMRARAALTAARRAVAAAARAAALRAETERKAIELQPLQALVTACRRYVEGTIGGVA